MSHSPAVSILLPVAHEREYLAAAAQSVLRQTLGDLELILIDDAGRTDELKDIAAGWNDGRVRVVACSGKGIADALNTGLSAASGSIWCRCDADDLYPPDRLARQVQFLAGHPEYGAVSGSMWAMTPAGKFLADMNGDLGTQDITDELRGGVARGSLCTWAVRMDLMRSVGEFRRYFITAEDIDLQFRIAERSRIFYDAHLAYHYRLHDTSTTHTQPNVRRIFFDGIAREFQRQRLATGADDLDRGCPPEPPPADAGVHTASSNTQLILMGASWEKHRQGRKGQALQLGWQACRLGPRSLAAWRSLGALAIKRAGSGTVTP
ncbi:MAG TPA: glycosyltransferase family A protein [Tepidisphaeraceae bacterium]|nr:glycosyltransferase family A protein [Tepidisphaeraceae bacterium]